MSYEDYLDYWIENYCKTAFRYRTVEEYSVIANKYLKHDLGHFRLNEITSYQLNSYLIDICNRYNYYYRYFRNFLKVIKCSFRIATDVYGFIKYNPSPTIELPRTINLKKDSRTCIYTRRARPYIK